MNEAAIEQPLSLDGQYKLKEISIVYFLTVTALYLFFIADFSNKIMIHLHFDYSRISLIPRAIYEVFFVTVILVFINQVRAVFLIILCLMFVSFIAGQIIFSANVYFTHNFNENIFIFNKYFFVFITYYAIYKLQYYPNTFARAIRVMEKLFLLNALLTIVGFIFSIEIFRTYIHQHYRFGYSGILWVQNESTIFYYLAICYFYYKRFILGVKSKGIFVVLLASVFLGTKGIYLFMVMLLLFHFAYHSKLKYKIATGILVIIIYFFVKWFLESEQAKIVLAYFVSKMTREGLWYMLFSGRTLYLSEIQTQILDQWTIFNYFLGGQDQSRFMIEMDLFDLFFFMGLLGFAAYFILLFATIFRFRIAKPFNLFFVFSFLSLAFLGGHFFSSVINAVYLCLVSMYFYTTQIPTERLNEKSPADQ